MRTVFIGAAALALTLTVTTEIKAGATFKDGSGLHEVCNAPSRNLADCIGFVVGVADTLECCRTRT